MNRTVSSEFTRTSKLVAVRLPVDMRVRVMTICDQEDLTLSQFLRRALRHELAPRKEINEQTHSSSI